ncbi:MAG TPA: Type 1 glutamine amidotransferase-like domain-containing protein, partial [Solirubrobacteraceae bacterium]
MRTILALGGGGFTAPPGDPCLDELVLQLAGAPVPRILFLPTASGDPRDQIGRFHAAFGDRPCEPEVLSLFRMGDLRRPLRDVLLSQDVIYVGGGSMRNLLAIWQVHGLDRMLRDAWERG